MPLWHSEEPLIQGNSVDIQFANVLIKVCDAEVKFQVPGLRISSLYRTMSRSNFLAFFPEVTFREQQRLSYFRLKAEEVSFQLQALAWYYNQR
ncbi:hypothetical protein ACJ72_08560 [Emergomyces africanus]|uniref:Uncharacterized protein n=1 Tax=Emergomyces africanus TaxID=1955775 RepID=A0A1B7NK43_9EURO|nr:hypothetical protein ACJ72_08560 [Emergomyces africanus]